MPNQNSNLNLTAIIIVALIVGGILLTIFYVFPKSSNRVIEIVGNAQFSAKPDKASVYIQVQTNATTAEEAKNANAKIYDNTLSALKTLGIYSSDIETENYNIYPNCIYTQEGQKCNGFIVSNAIKINTMNFDILGKIVDTAIDNGALINYINFDLSNEKSNAYKADALRLASEDAKKKAEAVALGQGKSVGELVSISVNEYNYLPVPIYSAESGGSVKQAVTNIQPKNLDITATVTVKYEIA